MTLVLDIPPKSIVKAPEPGDATSPLNKVRRTVVSGDSTVSTCTQVILAPDTVGRVAEPAAKRFVTETNTNLLPVGLMELVFTDVPPTSLVPWSRWLVVTAIRG